MANDHDRAIDLSAKLIEQLPVLEPECTTAEGVLALAIALGGFAGLNLPKDKDPVGALSDLQALLAENFNSAVAYSAELQSAGRVH